MSDDAAIDIRPTTVALVAGVVIAIAQTAPMLEIPLFFQIAQQYAPLLATIAPGAFHHRADLSAARSPVRC